MIFRTETFIYIYIGVCICMLGFNCLLVIYRRTERYFHNKQRYRYKKFLDVQCGNLKSNMHMEAETMHILEKQLRNIKQLQAFHHAIMEKSNEDIVCYDMFLHECKSLLENLVKVYRKKDPAQIAYFAYLISTCGIRIQGEKSEITDMMQMLLSHPSAYCRENALQAIYSFGDEKLLYYALKSLSDNGIFHHSKLITDGLLTFQGDKVLLLEILWDSIEEFTTAFQVSIINCIRMISPNYKRKFYDMLITNKTWNKEVKIAVIRYFSKHKYSKIKDTLIQMYENLSSLDWELGAVIVTVLKDYEGDDTIEFLAKLLYHQNWYICHNAAEGLRHRNVCFQSLPVLDNGREQYARKMLSYQMQKRDIIEEAYIMNQGEVSV